jgi:competence protein ComEA
LLEPDPGSEDGATLAELLEESAETRDEDRRRGRPLEPGERIDPNRATEVELDRLPGIGLSTALRIVEWREQMGGFAGPADLLAVRGIGPSTLEKIENDLDWSTNTKSGGQTGTALLDLNHANRAEVERLPGIGPTLAGRILELRASLGGFRRLEDLG